jgi:hypothetical protein
LINTILGQAVYCLFSVKVNAGDVRWRDSRCPFPDSKQEDIRPLFVDSRCRAGIFWALCYNGREIAEIFS